MNPLISVIVPIYNVEPYLKRCVGSLLAQTYRNLEIILVDDGSPDGCPAICDDYARNHQNIRVIHQDNAGLSGARNSGINAARGEYLAFVDSDDYVAADFITSLYGLLEHTDCAIAQCRFQYVRGEAFFGDREQDAPDRIYEGKELMAQLYGPEEEATYFVVAWNKLYRRDLFDHIRYPLGRIHEDEATTYKLFDAGQKLIFSRRKLYGYFLGNTGSITAAFSRKRLQWMTANEERIEFFQKHGYAALLPSAYRKLCDACITFYYRCTPKVAESGQLKRELRARLKKYQKEGAEYIRRLPARTRYGYELFRLSPSLYQTLLKRMKESS